MLISSEQHLLFFVLYTPIIGGLCTTIIDEIRALAMDEQGLSGYFSLVQEVAIEALLYRREELQGIF
jgi:hypothetical protein